MGASTAPRPDLASNPVRSISYGIAAATQIWQGQHCCVNGSGWLVPASDTSGLVYVGQALNSVNNTGAAGALSCPVQSPFIDRYFTLAANTPLQSWVGAHVFFVDDADVALAGGTSHTIIAGRCEAVLTTGTTGSVLINTIDRFAPATS